MEPGGYGGLRAYFPNAKMKKPRWSAAFSLVGKGAGYFMSSIWRARLMARGKRRWDWAGKPVYLRGKMRPWSVTNCLSKMGFLKSMVSTVKSILGLGLGVRRRSGVVPLPRPLAPWDFSLVFLRGMTGAWGVT